ncbi:MAG: PDZ domain-containing protein [Chthoniobacter sp.]|nr:PDZ domain-containing protein [Chthoniobacter sp.]
MKMQLTILALLVFLTSADVHAGLKRAESARPAEPFAEKPADKKSDGGLLEELLKRKAKNGRLELSGAEFEELLRGMLEKQGVPKDELAKMNLLDLLKTMREKNPNGAPRAGALELEGLLGFMDGRLNARLNEHFQQLLEGHKPGTAKAAPATFNFRDGKKPDALLALGAGVHPEGWLFTKASQVKDAAQLQCEVQGVWVAARVARIWEDHDLALVRVEARELPVVEWTKNSAPDIGSFITAVAPNGSDPVAIGVVSVATRNLQIKGRGFLGVGLDRDEKGLKVREVLRDGAAAGAGVQKDDRVLELDGQKAESIFTFTKIISDHKAGEKVKLKLQRGGDILEKEIQLGDRATQAGGLRSDGGKMNAMGTTLSKRKGDFPAVLQSDLPLEANQCGGPVTDLDGNVIGLVIARSGRVETMVIPSEVIRKSLAEVDFAKEEAVAVKP